MIILDFLCVRSMASFGDYELKYGRTIYSEPYSLLDKLFILLAHKISY